MKKSDLLKQNRAALEAEIKPLVDAAELSDEQTRSFDDLTKKIETLNVDIAREEKREAMQLANAAGPGGRSISETEEKEVASYSFARAIRLLSNLKEVDGLEGEMNQEGKKEFGLIGKEVRGFTVPMMVLNSRAATGQNVTTAADGGNIVVPDPFIFIESLKSALALTGMGATFLTGLVGNLPLLRGGSFTSAWVAEGANVSFTKEAFTKATMSPKNLMVGGAITKQLLVQTNNVAEKLIRYEIIQSIARGLQDAAINGSGVGAIPTGILATVGIGSVVGGVNGLVPTYGNIVDLETAITSKNAFGNIAYLSNCKVAGKLKQTLRAPATSGFILDNGITNGSPFVTTNAVPSNLTKGTSAGVCSAIIAGVWSELFIGMWGGLDILVDPYTRADYGEIKMVLNQFADVALRNPESFSAMLDALTV